MAGPAAPRRSRFSPSPPSLSKSHPVRLPLHSSQRGAARRAAEKDGNFICKGLGRATTIRVPRETGRSVIRGKRFRSSTKCFYLLCFLSQREHKELRQEPRQAAHSPGSKETRVKIRKMRFLNLGALIIIIIILKQPSKAAPKKRSANTLHFYFLW